MTRFTPAASRLWAQLLLPPKGISRLQKYGGFKWHLHIRAGYTPALLRARQAMVALSVLDAPVYSVIWRVSSSEPRPQDAALGQYVITEHAEELERIRQKGLETITEIIGALLKFYAIRYGVTSYGVNNGLCYNFAMDLADLVELSRLGTVEVGWGDEFVDPDMDHTDYQFDWHAVVKYQGKFYDAEYPEGVEDLREMRAFWL